jgi:hypothetical protein
MAHYLDDLADRRGADAGLVERNVMAALRGDDQRFGVIKSWLTRSSDLEVKRSANSPLGDLSGQFLPDPLWWRGESVKTTHDHSAQ